MEPDTACSRKRPVEVAIDGVASKRRRQGRHNSVQGCLKTTSRQQQTHISGDLCPENELEDPDAFILPTIERDALLQQTLATHSGTNLGQTNSTDYAEASLSSAYGLIPSQFDLQSDHWQHPRRAMTCLPDLDSHGHNTPFDLNLYMASFDQPLNDQPRTEFERFSLYELPTVHSRARSMPDIWGFTHSGNLDYNVSVGLAKEFSSTDETEISLPSLENDIDSVLQRLPCATTPGLTIAASSRATSLGQGARTPTVLEDASEVLSHVTRIAAHDSGLAQAVQSKNLSSDFLERFLAAYPTAPKALLASAGSTSTTAGEPTDSDSDLDGESESKTRVRRSGLERTKPPYPCPSGCDQIFDDTQPFRQHMEASHKDEYMLCKHTDCVKAVSMKEEPNMRLVWHYRSHHGQNALHCSEHPNCGFKVTFNEQEFIRHVESHKLRCNLCFDEGKRANPFANAENLKSHIRKMHSELSFPCIGYDVVKGRPCPQKFTTEAARTKHMNFSHRGNFLCPHCPADNDDAMHSTESSLALHIRDQHADEYNADWALKARERTYKCHFCNKLLSKASNLQKHISSLHGGERRFKCNATDLSASERLVDDDGHKLNWDPQGRGCGDAFANKQSLIDHVRSVHLGLMRWEALRKARSGRTLEMTAKRKIKQRDLMKASPTGVLSGISEK